MSGQVERLFFVHIQKTAGTSFRTLLDDVYGAQNVYPRIEQSAVEDPAVALDRYTSIHCALNDPYLEGYSAFVGHIPYAARELLPFDVVTASVLRHPVDRIVSLLDHLRRDAFHPDARELPIERLYDDPVLSAVMLKEFQTRMLGVTRADVERAGPARVLPVGPEGDNPEELVLGMRLSILHASFAAPAMFIETDPDDAMAARAHAALDSLDVVGVQERFEDFIRACAVRLDWPTRVVPEVNTNPERPKIADSFRARIEADNPLDMELFELARSRSTT